MPKHKIFTKKEDSFRLACIHYLSEHFSQYLQLKSCVEKEEAGTDFSKIYEEIKYLKNNKLPKNSNKAHIIWFQKKLTILLKEVTALKNKRVSKLSFPIL